jgi:hypothetical protein
MSAFLGINSVRLEKVEERLKLEVVKEAKSLGGLLLVHQELGKFFFSRLQSKGGENSFLFLFIIADGSVVPCYIAADQVQTPKEGKI